MVLTLLVTANAWAGPPAGDAVRTPEIVLKRIEPVRVVYVEHQGPYWTVGPQLDRLKTYMLAHGERGPLFTRYLDYPAESDPSATRAEIGFVTTSDHQPLPPFRAAMRDGELVASMYAEAPLARPPRYYRIMATWLSANGHRAAGPMTEIYHAGGGDVAGPQLIEMRLSIAPVHRVDKDEKQPSDIVASELPATMVEATPASSLPTPPPDALRHQVDAREAHAAPIVQSTAAPATLGELLADRRFERAASLLLPRDRAVPAAHQLWFGQLVFRVAAVGRGMKSRFPDETQDVTGWSTALTQRYKAISQGFGHDPLAQAVVSVDMHADPNAARKRAIMRDLDKILGQISVRSIDPREAAEQINKIMQRTLVVLEAAIGRG